MQPLVFWHPKSLVSYAKKRKTLAYLIDNIIQPNPYAKLTIEDIITDSICGLANLSLLPGDIELYDEFLVSEMMHQKSVNSDNTDNFDEVWNNFERVLVEQIVRPIAPNYDFIIMDCAPGYNLLTKSAIASSDFYLLPARPEPLSLVGIQLLERRVRNLKKSTC